MENEFFHVSVTKDSRKYTTFIVPNAHYEFLRIAFGLSTSLAYFQRKERYKREINAIFNTLNAMPVAVDRLG